MKRIYVGELEHQIYEKIKLSGEVTVREIYELFKMTRKYTTIMTVMNRMAEKKELVRRRKGIRFVYAINCKQVGKVSAVLNKVKSAMFDGKTKTMVSYLLKGDEKISKKELEEIEDIILNMKKARK